MSKSTRAAANTASSSSDVPREAQDDPHRLAQVYLRTRQVEHKFGWHLRFWRDDWWVWEGRCYRRLSHADLAADVTNAIKREFNRWAQRYTRSKKGRRAAVAKVTRSLLGNVLQALKGSVIVSAELQQPSWLGDRHTGGDLLALTNGLIDMDRLVANKANPLTQHSADWFSPVCLPYAFDLEAQCSRWLSFLAEMFDGDTERIALVQEWFGYCLVNDTSFQKLLILVGEGANGKTVLLDVLVALLGEQNVSHVPLELFAERFQLTPTLGKLANIVSEIGHMDGRAEATIKAFVAGDKMYFDRKNQSGVHTRPTARLVLATNALPHFADRSRGVSRRLSVLPCNVIIPVDKQDRQLTAKLKDELAGIFVWSVEGRRRLLAQQQFTEPAICRRLFDEFQAERNPERAFLLGHVRRCPGSSIVCGELHDACKTWCEGMGYLCGNDKQFGKEVQRVFSGIQRHRDAGGRGDKRQWRYVGLELERDDEPRDEPCPSVLRVPRIPISGPY